VQGEVQAQGEDVRGLARFCSIGYVFVLWQNVGPAILRIWRPQRVGLAGVVRSQNRPRLVVQKHRIGWEQGGIEVPAYLIQTDWPIIFDEPPILTDIAPTANHHLVTQRSHL